MCAGLGAALAGCHAAEVDARADAKLAESRHVAERRILYATCPDGARINPECGLLTRLVASDEFRARFREKVCQGKAPDACQEAYDRMVDAELLRRYYFADQRVVDAECTHRPGVCEDGVAYEKLLMTSHNTRAQARYDDDEQRIENERAAEHRADRAQTAAVIGTVLTTAAIVSGGRVCHSYPSVFGGVDSVCTR